MDMILGMNTYTTDPRRIYRQIISPCYITVKLLTLYLSSISKVSIYEIYMYINIYSQFPIPPLYFYTSKPLRFSSLLTTPRTLTLKPPIPPHNPPPLPYSPPPLFPPQITNTQLLSPLHLHSLSYSKLPAPPNPHLHQIRTTRVIKITSLWPNPIPKELTSFILQTPDSKRVMTISRRERDQKLGG